MKYLRQFGAFLYDFLVGDSWELFVGPIAAVAIAWVLLQMGVAAAMTGLLLFAMVIAIITFHLALALRDAA